MAKALQHLPACRSCAATSSPRWTRTGRPSRSTTTFWVSQRGIREVGGLGAGHGDSAEPGKPLRGALGIHHGPRTPEPGTGPPGGSGTAAGKEPDAVLETRRATLAGLLVLSLLPGRSTRAAFRLRGRGPTNTYETYEPNEHDCWHPRAKGLRLARELRVRRGGEQGRSEPG